MAGPISVKAWLTTCDAAFRPCPSDFSKADVVLLGQMFGGRRGKDLIAGRRLLPHTGHRG